jgi:peptidoglycan/xylan/chitin deacetylase (PgdA/CDA1 family)
MGSRIFILVYHNIFDDPQDPYAVLPREFERQMDWLKEHNYHILSLSQALDTLKYGIISKKCVVLTFDDGYTDFLENAAPVLKQHEFPATLFVVAGMVGGISRFRSPEYHRPLLDWKGIEEVTRLGFSIGSHSMNHPDLTSLPPEKLEEEIAASKKVIEDRLGMPITLFSYPFARYGKRETIAVEMAGYHCAVTGSSWWGNGLETDRFRLERGFMSVNESMRDYVRKVNGHEGLLRQFRHLQNGFQRFCGFR